MKKFRIIVWENERLKSKVIPGDLLSCGWGNGYVLIPPDSNLHGLDYEFLNGVYNVRVHGGLTYSNRVTKRMLQLFNIPKEYLGYWMVGFDTAHYRDTEETWPKLRVVWETIRLRIALEKLDETSY